MNAHTLRLTRCDRCGAAAKYEVVLASGSNLLFCGHHAKEHGPAIGEQFPILPISEGVLV